MTDNYLAGVTPLENLPDLQDLERGSGFGRVQKFIRNNTMNHHPNSGMMDSVPVPQEPYVPPPAQPKMYTPPPPPPPQHQEMYSREEPPYYHYSRDEPTCMELAAHVKKCPICSRFYNSDRTLYIITIIVLAIICLMLLKRVLNV